MAIIHMLPECTRHPEGLALLQSCRDTPDDVAPRLILTDWLEERGEAVLADFWRRSIQNPTKIYSLPCHVQQRWWPLTSCYRGWLACEVIDTDHLPPTELDVLTGVPWFTGIIFDDAGYRHHEKMVPYFKHSALEQLVFIKTNGGWPHVAGTQYRPEWPNLRYVIMNSSPHSHFIDAEAFCDDQRIRQVRSLVSEGRLFTSQNAVRLRSTKWFSGLQELYINPSSNPQDIEAVWSILHNTKFSQLERLRIDNLPIAQSDISNFANLQNWNHLQELGLTNCSLTTDDAVTLLTDMSDTPVTSLDLYGNLFSDDFGSQLVRLPLFSQITHLKLGGCKLGANTLFNILQSHNTQSLHTIKYTLDLFIYSIGARLFQHEKLNQLQQFHVKVINSSNATIAAFAKSPVMHMLTHLDLSGTQIGVSEMKALLNGPDGRIEHLNLEKCNITSEVLAYLAESPRLQTIRSLNLASNSIDYIGIQALAKSPFAQCLEELNLMFNPLNDRGIQAMISAPWLRQLRVLSLGSCNLTSSGIHQLLTADISKLEELVIWQNLLNDVHIDLSQHTQLLHQIARIIKWFKIHEIQSINNHEQFRKTNLFASGGIFHRDNFKAVNYI